jgi:hypothetical protein
MITRRLFFTHASAATAATLGTAGSATEPGQASKNPGSSLLNILEVGARGDGVTDDTDAIQDAIDFLCKRGAGTIFFPYTPKGYKIGKPAQETVDGKPCRGQLHIKPSKEYRGTNICFEGEHPCALLYDYTIRSWTRFDSLAKPNTFLFSTWEAPEERDYQARPWSMLTAVQGEWFAGKFGIVQVSIRNLEFRTYLNTDKMYPASSAVNLQNAENIHIQDSQFCLDKNIGDYELKKELQANPCHTVGLFASGNQNDNQILRNVAVQGYRYGFVLGEHIVADSLYVHNCEEAIVFHDSTHLSYIQHVVAQHNQKILTTTRENLFGTTKAPVYLQVEGIDYESGRGQTPHATSMTHGVYDPENRLHGTLKWHCGSPTGKDWFPVEGAKHMKIEKV